MGRDIGESWERVGREWREVGERVSGERASRESEWSGHH